MKKFLIAANIVIWSLVGYQVTAYAEPTKKSTAQKKEVKKHKKVKGTKIADDKPKAPAKKEVAKKK
jgi:hypothetical protein